MLDEGVYVEFDDAVGKENYQRTYCSRNAKRKLSKEAMKTKVLSMDITRKSNLEYQGGVGYSYLLNRFVPMCRGGVSDKFIRKMLMENPKRFCRSKR